MDPSALTPPLDPDFQPLSRLWDGVQAASGNSTAVVTIDRPDGGRDAIVIPTMQREHPCADEAWRLAACTVRQAVWGFGGVELGWYGPRWIGDRLHSVWSANADVCFDKTFLSRVWQHPFTLSCGSPADAPPPRVKRQPAASHNSGCALGFDAGATDRKVAAVQDGTIVYMSETVWDPRERTDPRYHYHQIQSALHEAASYLPRVDAIGVSAAGIYIDNRVRAASLFRGVPDERFDAEVAPLFLRIAEEWKVPLRVCNDGDVTALAGYRELQQGPVLGLALGSSLAGGYVDETGALRGWLNELAFCPIDLADNAPIDDWSGNRGIAAQYLSQQGVFRLAERAGLPVDPEAGPAERLKAIQRMHNAGDSRTADIYRTVGVWLGWFLDWLAACLPIRHVLLLGRVTTGSGGVQLMDAARAVLQCRRPDAQITLSMPSESMRRLGQAVHAASLRPA